MADEANPNAAIYAREEERRAKLEAWLKAGGKRPDPMATAPTQRAVEELPPHMTQLENDLAVCMATGSEAPEAPPPDPPVARAAPAAHPPARS